MRIRRKPKVVTNQPPTQPVEPVIQPPAEPLPEPREDPFMARIAELTKNPERMTLAEMKAFLEATRAAVEGVEQFMEDVRELAARVGAVRPVLEAVLPAQRDGDDGPPRPECGRSA